MNEIEKLIFDIERVFANHLNKWLNTSSMISGLLDDSQVKIREKENKIHVSLDIPGLTKEHQLDLNVHNDHLIVQGTIEKINDVRSDHGKRIKNHYSEYFYRTVPLPAKVTTKGAIAKYEDGVLKVELKKIAELEDGRIDILFK
ncbi:Hsp20/alpha crystallin family protein [Tepidibacillus infernus]|uniref:SHSP domain-containing protein n=1 Tax=Tepidibacillus decaturensis TaxID=1413211 RepID=A0A135L328_9BACI|nr:MULTISPECIES: Hsp20/alpha crystallin family protein [Tepidibacillus]KXG43263.1 hypothetical protein U473_03985 [Tepidibacillus decaturensis]GBF11011.1 hsp20/alpha crystallin family protein [Tepidibacillus sp. HK-1]